GGMMPISMTLHEWTEEGERLFGADQTQWAFTCPQCGHVSTVSDYLSLKAPPRTIGRACIGRLLPEIRALGDAATGPCNYVADRAAPLRILDAGETDFAFNFANPEDQ